ncbi:retrotransposon hot spot (RHS) protein, putative [Trypanosoma cruzi marinkellei]|uniref:Retrotransposon hot spot (RHS) protein, putative n=1 Tax=Trypanosoma cruzi marinkellei TaxID=85056 RepID=K2NSS9_TRYCR|nr:retrotransposon hot spot (RHS) protein, putative [Trypanosoma cruzi marinkellei]
MAAASYLLYQLLHYDAEKIQVVVHCFGEGEAYVFDKTTKTVTKYVGSEASENVVWSLSQRRMKGYIIYDRPSNMPQLPISFVPSTGWGTIVLASPKVMGLDEFARQRLARRIIMNCPDEMDVKAMCAWMKRGGTKDEQANYWWMVYHQLIFLGPIPRYIFDAKDFSKRYDELERVWKSIKSREDVKYITVGGQTAWCTENPFYQLMRVIREGVTFFGEEYRSDLLSRYLTDQVFSSVSKLFPLHKILAPLLR